MAAGDRNLSNGLTTDYVRHYSEQLAGEPLCHRKGYGYSTPNIQEITCKNCLNKLKNGRDTKRSV